MPDKIERRTVAGEIRAEGEGGMQFSGYAVRYGSQTNIGDPKRGGFSEVIAPGAFTRALASNPDVVHLFNHDSNLLLGRTAAGTVRLSEDADGIRVDGDLPDTSTGRDVATLLARGDLRGMSFGFMVPKGGDSWEKQPDGTQLRTVRDADLFDVSTVTSPAYKSTTASVRDAEGAEDLVLEIRVGRTISAATAAAIQNVVDALNQLISSEQDDDAAQDQDDADTGDSPTDDGSDDPNEDNRAASALAFIRARHAALRTFHGVTNG